MSIEEQVGTSILLLRIEHTMSCEMFMLRERKC